MFKKKFKVLIRHIGEGRCGILYSYNYTEQWKELREYYPSVKFWNAVLRNYSEAKELAKTFKSIDDINRFIAVENRKYKQDVPVENERIY